MAFALPCLCIVLCYARIFYIVRKTALRTQEPIISNSGSVRIPHTKKNNNQTKNAAIPNANNNGNQNHINGIEEKNLLQNEDQCHEIVKIQNGKDEIDNNGVSISRTSSRIQRTRPYLSKIDGFKFIDTSFESDFIGPTTKNLTIPEKTGLDTSLNTSTTSINKTVEFTKTIFETGANVEQQEVDSAFEVSTTCSADKYQVRPSFY